MSLSATAAVLPTVLLKKHSSFFRIRTSFLLTSFSAISVSSVSAAFFSTAFSATNMITRSSSTVAVSKKRCAASPDNDLLDVVNTSRDSSAAVTTTPVKPKSRRKKKKNNRTLSTAVVTPLPDPAASISSSSAITTHSTSIPSFASAATNFDSLSSSCIDLTKLINLDDDHFQDLHIPPEELRPSAVVTVGQSFHWRALLTLPQPTKQSTSSSSRNSDSSSNHADVNNDTSNNKTSSASAWGTHDATQWLGILRRRRPTTAVSKTVKQEDSDASSSFESLVVILRETPTTTLYRVLYPTQPNDIDASAFLLEYFRLQEDASSSTITTTSTITTSSSPTSTSSLSFGTCLKDLYNEWSKACPRLEAIATVIPGVRIIQQDPLECLLSFICSTNNNIPRITKMLTHLRQIYGTPLIRIKIHETEEEEEETLYSFPSLQQLLKHATEQELRNMGFGYRAPYIIKTIHQLDQLGGEDYLHHLRNDVQNANDVQEALIQFTGVGRKVADCVALFSLQQDDAIPVDVHVWKIARRDYDNHNDTQQKQRLLSQVKSLTPTIYRHVGDLFRTKFPIKSGWAHALLFVAELPSFRPILPKHVVDEMDKFRIEQLQLTKLAKEEQEKKKKTAAATITTTATKKAARK